MSGIHPETIRFYERYEKGERVLWLSSLRFLFCYSRTYTGHPDRVVWDWCPYGFEVAYPFDDKGQWSRERIAVVKFNSLYGQLSDGSDLLSSQDADGNILASAVLDHIVAYCMQKNIHAEPRHLKIVDGARAFFAEASIIIPSSEWMKALPSKRH